MCVLPRTHRNPCARRICPGPPRYGVLPGLAVQGSGNLPGADGCPEGPLSAGPGKPVTPMQGPRQPHRPRRAPHMGWGAARMCWCQSPTGPGSGNLPGFSPHPDRPITPWPQHSGRNPPEPWPRSPTPRPFGLPTGLRKPARHENHTPAGNNHESCNGSPPRLEVCSQHQVLAPHPQAGSMQPIHETRRDAANLQMHDTRGKALGEGPDPPDWGI